MASSKKSVVTKHTTKVDGVYVPPNVKIGLDPDEAEDKLRRGLVRRPRRDDSEGRAARLKPEGDGLSRAIALRIPELDKDDRESWTADGKPNTRALAELLGYPITGKERDEGVAYLKQHGEQLKLDGGPAA